ncbi:MAG: YdiU family protein [Baekduia sp.]
MPFAGPTPLPLSTRFADRFPELSAPWHPAACPDPRLVVLNAPLALELGLDPATLQEQSTVDVLSGAAEPPGAHPVAQAYAGHQFGMPVPRLGDGRAVLLGELRTPAGDLVDVHLKGSGRTVFARGGDGRAVIGPMLREYLVSEAMHALGIPTTRSLAVCVTGEQVAREQGDLPGAVLTRVAASHLRVGSFEYAARNDDPGLVRRLADEAIDRHHPSAADAEDPYLALLRSVCEVQARLVALWMSAGFVHGVMNTDNTTISGETIDYGPCAFIDRFDPQVVFSSIDHSGRYAYGAQPSVAQWNLARLAETLVPLIAGDTDQAVAAATAELDRFAETFGTHWRAGMYRKLGLATAPAEGEELIRDLLDLMRAQELDYTGTLRGLSAVARGDRPPPELAEWASGWVEAGPDAGLMDRVNPVYIPRSHLVEDALAAATAGDVDPFSELLRVVTQPFDEKPGRERYAEPGAPGDLVVTYCGT